jgi:hypothetical protein
VVHRALVVHPSPTAVAEISDVLATLVSVDLAHTEADAARHLGAAEYSVVVFDR